VPISSTVNEQPYLHCGAWVFRSPATVKLDYLEIDYCFEIAGSDTRLRFTEAARKHKLRRAHFGLQGLQLKKGTRPLRARRPRHPRSVSPADPF
jgi:hypothetical protein